MASYALQLHLRLRTQSRLGQKASYQNVSGSVKFWSKKVFCVFKKHPVVMFLMLPVTQVKIDFFLKFPRHPTHYQMLSRHVWEVIDIIPSTTKPKLHNPLKCVNQLSN